MLLFHLVQATHHWEGCLMEHFKQAQIEEAIFNHVYAAYSEIEKALKLADHHDAALRERGSFIPTVYETPLVKHVRQGVDDLCAALHDARYDSVNT